METSTFNDARYHLLKHLWLHPGKQVSPIPEFDRAEVCGEIHMFSTKLNKKQKTLQGQSLCSSLTNPIWLCLIHIMTWFFITLTFVKQITCQVQPVFFSFFYGNRYGFHDSYKGQCGSRKKNPSNIESVGKDVTLTALRRENESAL